MDSDQLNHHRNGGNDDDGDAAEWKQVAELRAIAEAQDPACKEEDDFMLRRFLRARDRNVGKACAMLVKYVKWKRTAKPNAFISEEEVANEIPKGKLYLQGYDKQGRPLIYGFGAKHYPSKRDLDEFKRYVIYVLDKTVSRLPASGQEKFAAVADLKGWGYSNCDIRAYLAALDIMQNYYPERLGKVFLIHVPYVFMAAWKIVYPFIDDNTKKKFVFVSDKDLDKTLKEAIDDTQLPEEYGGKLKLVSGGARAANNATD
ncbi:hypothetical protein PR202_gb10240 [Eleusine coracana subsp. coracana]|uniref:CRAL-TRIO domain-containing protein n=1 Tax=Eleusine coracana subsp. coracana TaxID=191504 RepID=A0AAV5EIP3_ELECO|nr:hypothetical protein QOZ80_3BG0253290 [Eleusine coracana subsp. coracana]GJN22652.1 hypothetical protein PR202_gb10240 [Eleusine coracana subsp. coracana]